MEFMNMDSKPTPIPVWREISDSAAKLKHNSETSLYIQIQIQHFRLEGSWENYGYKDKECNLHLRKHFESMQDPKAWSGIWHHKTQQCSKSWSPFNTEITKVQWH